MCLDISLQLLYYLFDLIRIVEVIPRREYGLWECVAWTIDWPVQIYYFIRHIGIYNQTCLCSNHHVNPIHRIGWFAWGEFFLWSDPSRAWTGSVRSSKISDVAWYRLCSIYSTYTYLLIVWKCIHFRCIDSALSYYRSETKDLKKNRG